MLQVSLDEAKERLSELLSAAERGEEVAIASEDGTKTFQLTVTVSEQPRVWRQLGTARGMFTIPDDFDDLLPGFEEYVQCGKES